MEIRKPDNSFDEILAREKIKLVLSVAFGLICFETVIFMLLRITDPRVQSVFWVGGVTGPLIGVTGIVSAMRAKVPESMRDDYDATGELPKLFLGPRGIWWWLNGGMLLLTLIAIVVVLRTFRPS